MPRTTDSPTLLPSSDVDAGWSTFGGPTTRWECVDEGVATADDATTYILTTSDLAVQTLGVVVPSNLNVNDTVIMAVHIRYRNSSKWVDDTHQLRVRLMHGATQISTQTINVVSTAWATSTSVAGVTTTLTKAQWDTLRIELMFDRTVVGMTDSAGVDVTAVEIHPFTYTIRASNVT